MTFQQFDIADYRRSQKRAQPVIDHQDNVLRDGEALHIPLNFMDSVQQQVATHFKDAPGISPRQTYIDRLTNAWRA